MGFMRGGEHGRRADEAEIPAEPEEDEGGDPGDSWEAWAARDQVKVPHVVPAEEAAATPAPPTPWKKEPFDGLSSLTSVFPEVTANSTGITTFYMMGDSP